MTFYREFRASLFRLVTALVFVGAIGLFNTSGLRADFIYGSCASHYNPRGCDIGLGGFPYCADEFDCVTNPYTAEQDLCYCMGDYLCYWWPGGCAE